MFGCYLRTCVFFCLLHTIFSEWEFYLNHTLNSFGIHYQLGYINERDYVRVNLIWTGFSDLDVYIFARTKNYLGYWSYILQHTQRSGSYSFQSFEYYVYEPGYKILKVIPYSIGPIIEAFTLNVKTSDRIVQKKGYIYKMYPKASTQLLTFFPSNDYKITFNRTLSSQYQYTKLVQFNSQIQHQLILNNTLCWVRDSAKDSEIQLLLVYGSMISQFSQLQNTLAQVLIWKSNTSTQCPSTSTSTNNTGIIIGSVVGSVSLIAIIIGIAIYFKKRKKRGNPQRVQGQDQGQPQLQRQQQQGQQQLQIQQQHQSQQQYEVPRIQVRLQPPSQTQQIQPNEQQIGSHSNTNIFRNQLDSPARDELIPEVYSTNEIQARQASCAICLYDNCDVVSACIHLFHKQCITQWVRRDPHCPICRKLILIKSRRIKP